MNMHICACGDAPTALIQPAALDMKLLEAVCQESHAVKEKLFDSGKNEPTLELMQQAMDLKINAYLNNLMISSNAA